MLQFLATLVGKKVELFVGGKFLRGHLLSVDTVNKLFTFDDGTETWTGAVDQLDMVREDQ